MLEGLDLLPWDNIRHIYGPATDLPDALRASISGGKFHEDEFWEFFNLICHQGTTSEASVAIVPFLVDLATDPEIPKPDYFFLALASISDDPDNRAAHDRVAKELPVIVPYLNHKTPILRAAAANVMAQFPEKAKTFSPKLRAAIESEVAVHFMREHLCARAFMAESRGATCRLMCCCVECRREERGWLEGVRPRLVCQGKRSAPRNKRRHLGISLPVLAGEYPEPNGSATRVSIWLSGARSNCSRRAPNAGLLGLPSTA